MTWAVKKTSSKGEAGYPNGRSLLLGHSENPGWALWVTTWAMGCSQGMVQGFGNCYGLTKKAVDDLILLLDKLGDNGDASSSYFPRRYLLTLRKDWVQNPDHIAHYIASKCKLLDSYENLAHKSSGVNLYMLTTKKES